MRLLHGASALLAAVPGQEGGKSSPIEDFAGIYGTAEACVSIARFDPGDGEVRLLFTDLASGMVRVLAPAGEDVFTAGPGLFVAEPVETRFTFRRGEDGRVSAAARDSSPPLPRIAVRREAVDFKNGDVALSGTLILPAGTDPRTAVVLLHGSGALGRDSFGPFPDFLVSRGFAVLVYDKRGTGKSKGTLDDATLEDLAADGRAAVEFLKTRADVRRDRIGLCGASQGGFLAAAVAAGNADVAFLVDLYGMYVPVHEQERFRAEMEMRDRGLAEEDVAAGLAFIDRVFEVGRSGEGWDELVEVGRASGEKAWFEHVPHSFASLRELRHYHRTLYSHDPCAALERVACPVLGLFGELDRSTPVARTVANMEKAFEGDRRTLLTTRVFPKCGHGMIETETGSEREIPAAKRIAPDLFPTLAKWLEER